MKKILSLYAVFCILFSVSVFFNCNEKEISLCHSTICNEETETQSESSHCLICTTHSESTHFTMDTSPKISLNAVFLGEIFFRVINIYSEKNITLPDRPPCLV